MELYRIQIWKTIQIRQIIIRQKFSTSTVHSK